MWQNQMSNNYFI